MQKKVLITGGASGLGKALAIKWASSGADIFIADIHTQRAQETVKEIQSMGVEAEYFYCNIGQQKDVDALREAIDLNWGMLDLVINNAGIASADALADEDILQWENILNINLLGAVRVTKAFTPMFKSQGHGYFLNVASQAGITPVPKMGSYNASKAALVSFSETMRLELTNDNIQVSVLCPSFFQTNLKESLKTKDPNLAVVLDKMMKRAKISAADVANAAFNGVRSELFLILTHSEGKQALRLKRWLPNFYLKLMQRKTAGLRQS